MKYFFSSFFESLANIGRLAFVVFFTYYAFSSIVSYIVNAVRLSGLLKGSAIVIFSSSLTAVFIVLFIGAAYLLIKKAKSETAEKLRKIREKEIQIVEKHSTN